MPSWKSGARSSTRRAGRRCRRVAIFRMLCGSATSRAGSWKERWRGGWPIRWPYGSSLDSAAHEGPPDRLKWIHPHDPDAKMKDRRTRMAYRDEHAVDLETGAVLGVTVQNARAGDTRTIVKTLVTAAEQVEAILPTGGGVADVVADQNYHSKETMVALPDLGLRRCLSEPDRGRRRWRGQHAARGAVHASRRRIRKPRGRRLLRQRGERLERPSAHLYETGRLRRVTPAGVRQHPEAPSGARLRFQSRPAPWSPDGRRHAAQPLGRGPALVDAPRLVFEPLLAPRIALSGTRDASAPGSVADRCYGVESPVPSARAPEKALLDHGLLGIATSAARRQLTPC